MLWRTHVLGGAAAGLLIAGCGGSSLFSGAASSPSPKLALTSALVSGLAALLPDIDDPNSRLGRLIPVAPFLIKYSVGHRGPLHSIVGALVFSLLISVVVGRIAGIPCFFDLVLFGYLSHLALDSLSGQCPWLWPLPLGFGVPLVRTRSVLERLVVTPAVLALCLYLAWPVFVHGAGKLVARVLSFKPF